VIDWLISSVCALQLPLPVRLSSVPNFTSSLLLFFVQPLFRNFVINCRACNLYTHTDFWSKFCLLYWTASKLARLLSSKFALFSVSGLKDEKLIKMQIFMKTETCKLCSRVSWIFLPNIVKIYPYNFELNRFKVWSFFLRHSVHEVFVAVNCLIVSQRKARQTDDWERSLGWAVELTGVNWSRSCENHSTIRARAHYVRAGRTSSAYRPLGATQEDWSIHAFAMLYRPWMRKQRGNSFNVTRGWPWRALQCQLGADWLH